LSQTKHLRLSLRGSSGGDNMSQAYEEGKKGVFAHIFDKEDFNLTDKIYISLSARRRSKNDEWGDRCLKLEDVKEFIRLLKEEMSPISAIYNDDYSLGQNNTRLFFIDFIDKLAGEKLI